MNQAAQTVAHKDADSSEKIIAFKLIAALDDQERTVITNQAANVEMNAVLKELLDEADRQRSKLPPAEIEQIARIALRLAELHDEPAAAARAWLTIGNTQSNAADKFPAYANALSAAKRASADELAVKILISIGQAEKLFERSILWYKQAIEFAEKVPDKKVLSSLLARIGNSYTMSGDYDSARQFHERALKIRKETNDVLGVAGTISNLGIIYGTEGDMLSSLRHFQESYQLLQTLEGRSPDLIQRKAKDLRNIGIAYTGLGDTAQAMAYYSKSLKLSEDEKYEDGVWGALFQIADLYISQGDYELARQAAIRMEAINNDPILMSIVGRSYLGEGKYDEAITAFQKRANEHEKKGAKDSLARSLMDIGGIYLLRGNLEKAESNYDRALELARKTDNDTTVMWGIIGVAKCKVMRGDLAGAIANAELAKEQYKKLRGVQEYWEIYATMAAAYEGLGQAGLARDNFEKAVAIVEARRKQSELQFAEQQGLTDPTVKPFHLAIDFFVRSASLDTAFWYAERAKANTLLDVLGNGKIRIDRVLTTQEKQSEQNLRSDLISLNSQIKNKNVAPSKLVELTNRLADKRLEYAAFQNQIYVGHPELAVQRGEMKAITLGETSSLIPNEKTALAEYVVADGKTFLYVITKGSSGKSAIRAHTINIKQRDLAELVESYRKTLETGDIRFNSSSRAIYDLLIKPAESSLVGITNLIVVPDGPLWDLPFQALQNDRMKYIAERLSISYTPSLTALREMQRKAKARRASDRDDLLAFGNPVVGAGTSGRITPLIANEKLEPLPEAEHLVNELGKLYGPSRSRVFVGANATEGNAKTQAPGYRTVQFATHGVLNNASPMYSHLVLSQKEKSLDEDGLLEAWEMKDLDLNADLVILSACDTARGKVSGEGVIGMTWALFIAGTPSTVASQWQVESTSTTEYMLEFHRQLLNGKTTKAEALRRASLKLLKSGKFSHPSYWAGWVLVGDGS